ncbi:TPA: inorganic pyrophosphatase [Candidatus Dojkabacteria bacterium]|uniref:Inorganic pyrophosphatase n=1 Tax=Candidatus Dojkabacteria bacterium TaxID=2099670 RepID=A0A832RCG7_9BACT|nr:inorganic pyrophosphatase [Candidatus Dojkabacteria bacterium]
MIGETVKVIVDRPMGSVHPKHPNIKYSVNYGYIEGVKGGDGEEQDVYILGPDKPLKEWEGKIIAIIHRNNDIEEKWVAAPEGMDFTDEEIIEQTHFQEQYYDIKIKRK